LQVNKQAKNNHMRMLKRKKEEEPLKNDQVFGLAGHSASRGFGPYLCYATAIECNSPRRWFKLLLFLKDQ
jgi:hypothetical protein